MTIKKSRFALVNLQCDVLFTIFAYRTILFVFRNMYNSCVITDDQLFSFLPKKVIENVLGCGRE